MFFVYILKSLKDGRFYYGSTSDLQNRLKIHNSGKVRSTRNRRPFILHYHETFEAKQMPSEENSSSNPSMDTIF